MIAFADLLYARSMDVFGAQAVLTVGAAQPVAITAIDRTAGVEVTDDTIGIQTVQPAADVRRADLDAATVDLAALDGATLALNGTTWTVHSIMEMPTPSGASDGLVRLMLVG